MNHTLSVLVEDKPGVLARVSSLLARRGFNIHSLAVGPSNEDGMSKMTIVVEAPELEQVKKQLHKLINVVKITELEADQAIEREVMMVRVSTPPGKRSEVLEIAAIFKAVAVDVGHATVCFQVSGEPAKINDFLDLVRPYGVVDLVKSGRIALARDQKGKPQGRLRAVN
ncbi:MAG TPA: acetolactate synthase small subunit [Acidimicrobiia bacterium]|jgi:acetolactate synthase I/III small subunit|nr:acetolactate synthase small subunit [Acidimicrobiia bacterium]